MSEHFLFYIGLSFLTVHELDAMRCSEWRILPGLSLLTEKLGQKIFIVAHIPLFFWIFYILTNDQNPDNFIKGFDIFMIIHIGLHLLLLKNKNNNFKDFTSWVIIVGSGFFGFMDLIN